VSGGVRREPTVRRMDALGNTSPASYKVRETRSFMLLCTFSIYSSASFEDIRPQNKNVVVRYRTASYRIVGLKKRVGVQASSKAIILPLADRETTEY